MSKRTIRRHARTRRAEQQAALRWAARHGLGSLPGPRLDTGESATPERSDFFGGADRAETGTGGGHSKFVSVSQFPTLEAWEDWMLDTGQDYVPLVGGATPTGLEQAEKRARMAHVLSFLLPEHVELLFERHINQRTLEDIAEEHSVSRQAISKRLAVAEQDFRRAFGQHWNDPLDPKVLREEGEHG